MKIPDLNEIPVLNRLPSWVLNKYFLILVAYGFYMIFFDSNDFRSQYKLRSQLMELRKEKAFLMESLEQVRKEREQLFSDMKSMEKFAREQYLMKKDDETLFVIVEE